MRATTALVVLALVSLLGCSESAPEALPADEAKGLIENRNWLDSWPQSENDRLFVYRFTPAMGGGVYQDRTLFSGRFELFNYKLSSDVVVITWPDRGVVETVHYRIEEVDGPKPFDLKLSLDGTGLGPKVFYGIRAETQGELEGSAKKTLMRLNQ